MKVTGMITAVNKEKEWLLSVQGKEATPAMTKRKRRLVEVCVSILRMSFRDYNGWLDRMPQRNRRTILQHDYSQWTSPEDLRALIELVDLVLSDLNLFGTRYANEHNGVWWTQFADPRHRAVSVGCLEILARARAARKAKAEARMHLRLNRARATIRPSGSTEERPPL